MTQGNNNVYAQYRGYINDIYYNLYFLNIFALWEERLDIDDQKEFEDTKGGIRIRKSKKKITQWKKEKEQKDKKRYTNPPIPTKWSITSCLNSLKTIEDRYIIRQ